MGHRVNLLTIIKQVFTYNSSNIRAVIMVIHYVTICHPILKAQGLDRKQSICITQKISYFRQFRLENVHFITLISQQHMEIYMGIADTTFKMLKLEVPTIFNMELTFKMHCNLV